MDETQERPSPNLNRALAWSLIIVAFVGLFTDKVHMTSLFGIIGALIFAQDSDPSARAL